MSTRDFHSPKEAMTSDPGLDGLRQALKTFDDRTDAFCEEDVRKAIYNVHNDRNLLSLPMEYRAETMAFDFRPKPPHGYSAWGTYYGPKLSFSDDNGNLTEYPKIQDITPEMLAYWAGRAREVTHPILRARYADLVWDFSKKITSKAASVEMAHQVIDSTITISRSDNRSFRTDTVKKLQHALSLAIAINDSERIGMVRDAILCFGEIEAQDGKPGLWVFVYDLLIENKKVSLSPAQQDTIIQVLEGRLHRLSNPPEEREIHLRAAEAATLRLARWYRRLNQQEEMRRVLLAYGALVEKKAATSPALTASVWLQQIYELYLQYGLREEAERIAIVLRELGPKTHAEMQSFSATIEITDDKMEQYVEELTRGDLGIVLARIARYYVPLRHEVEANVRDMAQQFVHMSLTRIQLQDYKGRVMATLGSPDVDLEGHVIHRIAQDMRLGFIFLRRVLKATVERFDLKSHDLLTYMYQSPLFEDCKKSIIEAGLEAYLRDDFLVAIHLLIPQFEDAIRTFVEKSGGAVYRKGRNGGLNLKTLDELLREQTVIDALGDDVTLYFRCLFTDPRGVNLRNIVCHGMMPAELFQVGDADRVLHAMICLAQVRHKSS